MKKLELEHNLYISYRQQKFGDNNSPTIVFLHGLMSDKNGSKALSIEEYCKKNRYNFITFDNLGHGESSGNFTSLGISDWLEAAKKVITLLELNNVILVGSSKGGWLALLIAISKPSYLKGLILLAPAPDFTTKIWGNLSSTHKQAIQNNEIVYIKSTPEYSGIPISMQLIEDGKNNLIMQLEEISIDVPVVIIHGMEDKDVDYKVSLELNNKINAPHLCLKLLKYSGHRLSSESDLLAINNSIDEIIECSRHHERNEV